MKIEVKNTAVITRQITPSTGKNAGKQVTFYEQEAWAHLCNKDGTPHPYPSRTLIGLENPEAPIKPGMYTLGDSCFFVDRFGKLALGRLQLQPVAQSVSRAA